MASGMRVQAKVKNDVTQVKALITHPMETGNRKDKKSGKVIPANFIEEVLCEHNGKAVMTAQWSGGISKNPYMAFKFKGGAKDEMVKVSWRDNLGKSASLDVKIK
ncbi:thiosulfate oxidation carrier complex protein SoxZ [Candidatus Venteria ishoeyi]|uniref:Sulphur oxidation protein SoxZ n=1 Tax=Candidatus Venteria ishoeyi TaxID=1899563 RepID=A0A1H6FEJ7_9GAMM|nr:thiosulfate oxidation carrier complex protein SoxZ [Candidatus Venteria ishoeyi]MDM8546430.1 thiosulfate oxidation carrier complex protein SoxZ [Candidatus Venteria ishoeyi]SEH08510.1 Sulphur oxidation protein SoxZ [Candidatus Venteria ishoeyi]